MHIIDAYIKMALPNILYALYCFIHTLIISHYIYKPLQWSEDLIKFYAFQCVLLQNDNILCESQDCLCIDLYGMVRYIVNPKIVCVLICCERKNKMEI